MSINQNDNSQNDNNRSMRQNTSKNVVISTVSAFENNVFYTFAKKTEKLTTAIHMVSKFITTAPDLRDELRAQSIVLLRHVYACIGRDTMERFFIARDAMGTAEHIVSLLGSAKMLGSVSVMNAEMLERELRLLIMHLDRESQLPEDAGFLMSGDDHIHDMDESALADFLHSADEISDEQSFDFSERTSATHSKRHQNDMSYTTKNKTTTPHASSSKTTSNKTTGSAKKRQELITDIIREKGEVTIKDLATRITNCSEKTLQRDLLKLIKNNAIVKEGDKRWSVYKIKG